MKNHYAMATALAAWAMTPRDVTDEELRGILTSASDVPEDRLDACFAEMKQALEPTRQMVELITAMAGPQTARQLEEVFGESMWIDDDKGTAKYGVQVIDPGTGEETLSLSIKGKL